MTMKSFFIKSIWKFMSMTFLASSVPTGGGKPPCSKWYTGLLKPYSGEVIYPVSRQNLFGYLPQNSRFDQAFSHRCHRSSPLRPDVRKGTLQILYPSRKTKSGIYSINTVWEHIRKHRSAIYRGGQIRNGYSFAGRSCVSRILILDERRLM